MATAAKPTTIRVDENLKARANEILGSVGLSYNTYVVMAPHQLVNQCRIPFEIVPAGALVAAEAKELGLIPDDAPAFDDIDGLVAFLEKE